MSNKINYFLLVAMSIIWGGQFALNKIVLLSMTPSFIMVWRAVLGFIVLLIYVLIFSKSLPGKHIRYNIKTVIFLYILIGLTEIILPSFLIAWGCQHIDSGVAAILMSLVPIFTMLIACFLNKKSLNSKMVFAVVLGFIGIIILILPSDTNAHSKVNSILGVLALALSALNFSIGITLIKFLPHNVSSVKHMLNILAFTTIILLIFYLLFLPHPVLAKFSIKSIVALVTLGIFAAGIAYVMYIALVHRTSSLFTSFVNYMIPIIGVGIGNIFMREAISWSEIVALLCVFVALYLITPRNNT